MKSESRSFCATPRRTRVHPCFREGDALYAVPDPGEALVANAVAGIDIGHGQPSARRNKIICRLRLDLIRCTGRHWRGPSPPPSDSAAWRCRAVSSGWQTHAPAGRLGRLHLADLNAGAAEDYLSLSAYSACCIFLLVYCSGPSPSSCSSFIGCGRGPARFAGRSVRSWAVPWWGSPGESKVSQVRRVSWARCLRRPPRTACFPQKLQTAVPHGDRFSTMSVVRSRKPVSPLNRLRAARLLRQCRNFASYPSTIDMGIRT